MNLFSFLVGLEAPNLLKKPFVLTFKGSNLNKVNVVTKLFGHAYEYMGRIRSK